MKWNSPFSGASDVWNIVPPRPGTGFIQIQQSVIRFGGSRKVTFSVTPAGTTFGVTDPHSLPDAVLAVLGQEQRPGCGALVADGDGPGPCTRRDGTGRGRVRRRDRRRDSGSGLGVGVGAGVGRATTAGGSDTPAGTYSSAALRAPSAR